MPIRIDPGTGTSVVVDTTTTTTTTTGTPGTPNTPNTPNTQTPRERGGERTRDDHVGLPTRRASNLAGTGIAGGATPGTAGALAPPRMIKVWAFESDQNGPGGLQQIPRRHFELDADGRVIGLRGPRVRVTMPEEIATEVDINFDAQTSEPSGLADPVPSRDESFIFPKNHPATGATTAFYAATAAIDGADLWVGHRVPWGVAGTLTITPYAFVTDSFNAYFSKKDMGVHLGALGRVGGIRRIRGFTGTPDGWKHEIRRTLVDAAKSHDIVAHEAGHAIVAAIKPGFAYGISAAINEGIADVIAWLTALQDADVVARVLDETGGDLRLSNEVSRLAEFSGHIHKLHGNDDPDDDDEQFMRDSVNELDLAELGLRNDRRDLEGAMFLPELDPHNVGTILSGMAWDLFATLYERGLGDGATPEAAIAAAADATGKLILRALRYVPEHFASFHDFGDGMVLADYDSFDGAHANAFMPLLKARGFLHRTDAPAIVRTRRERDYEMILDPSVTDPEAVRAAFFDFEAAQLDRVNGGDERATLLWHSNFMPELEDIDVQTLELHSDTTADDGIRIVRFRYQYDAPGSFRDHTEEGGPDVDTPGAGDRADAFMAFILGADGKLLHQIEDRPTLPTDFMGYPL